LEAFASEEVSASILTTALAAAREPCTPDGGERLRRFVERDLARETRSTLGAEVSSAITQALRPMARMLPDASETSHIRARRPAPRPPERPTPDRPGLPWSSSPRAPATAPAPAEHSPELQKRSTATPPELDLPMVILATRSPEREKEITSWLGYRATLSVVHDAVQLLQSVEVAMKLAPVIVVDCVVPAVQLETLLMLAEELPKGATVVLWGVADDRELDDFAVDHGTQRFIRCSPAATARDLGALLTPFIDR
jgi:hypothetical protein